METLKVVNQTDDLIETILCGCMETQEQRNGPDAQYFWLEKNKFDGFVRKFWFCKNHRKRALQSLNFDLWFLHPEGSRVCQFTELEKINGRRPLKAPKVV